MKWKKVKQVPAEELDNILTRFQNGITPLLAQLKTETERLRVATNTEQVRRREESK